MHDNERDKIMFHKTLDLQDQDQDCSVQDQDHSVQHQDQDRFFGLRPFLSLKQTVSDHITANHCRADYSCRRSESRHALNVLSTMHSSLRISE